MPQQRARRPAVRHREPRQSPRLRDCAGNHQGRKEPPHLHRAGRRETHHQRRAGSDFGPPRLRQRPPAAVLPRSGQGDREPQRYRAHQRRSARAFYGARQEHPEHPRGPLHRRRQRGRQRQHLPRGAGRCHTPFDHRQHRRRPRLFRAYPPPAETPVQYPGLLLRQPQSAQLQRRRCQARLLAPSDLHLPRRRTRHRS